MALALRAIHLEFFEVVIVSPLASPIVPLSV
jgi:hypothetical protein